MDRIDRLRERYERTQMNGWRALDPAYPYGEFFDVEDPTAVLKRFPYISIMDEPGIEARPICIRKALAIKKSFSEVALRVLPEELIVGSTILNWKYCEFATPKERERYIPGLFSNHMLSIMKGSNIEITSSSEDKSRFVRESGYGALPCIEYFSWIHTTAGFPKILEKGYLGIAQDARALKKKEEEKKRPDREKCDFWESVIISCEAVVHYSERYALYLDYLAEDEMCGERKAELVELAEIMRQVPAHKPRTFHEAVQSVWFSLMCTQRFVTTDIGRLDQFLYPFYRADLEKGRLTTKKAQELLECLWLKLAEHVLERDEARMGLSQNVILSGKAPDGSDCTNEVTYMCLKASMRLRMITPKVTLRIHRNSPQKLFETAREMLLSGLSMPDFFNDDVAIPAFVNMGATYEDAHEYVHCVCEETMIGGMSEDRAAEIFFLPIKALELALNNGYTFLTGKCDGAHTGEPETFLTFAELWEAYRAQILYSVKREIQKADETERYIRYIAPQPLHSASIVGCVESGRDSTDGGCRYNGTGCALTTGLANAVDSLYVIKKLVYEEKRLALTEFIKILKNNYEGNEAFRQEILNKFPKYGNAIEEVDLLLKKTLDIYIEELKKYRNPRGGVYKIGLWGNNVSDKGREIGASADGRKSGTYLSMNLSPVIGSDAKGITAVIHSASVADHSYSSNGGTLDLTLNQNYLAEDKGVKVLEAIVRGYFSQGGFQLQFNVLDAATLIKAKEHPDQYRNLMVRVWGYSDYFVKIPPAMQENIINRALNANKFHA